MRRIPRGGLSMARVCVIGTGYVGLTTGACFANLGNEVVCLDVDAAKIALLRGGGMPIYEPGLEEVVQRNAAAGRLRFATDYAEAVPGAEVLFIAVNTPQGAGGHADMAYVERAAATLAQHLSGPAAVGNQSTMPIRPGRPRARTVPRAPPAPPSAAVPPPPPR